MAKITLMPEKLSRRFDSLAKNRNKVAWGYFGILEEYIVILSLMKEYIKCADIQMFTNDNRWHCENTKQDFMQLEEGIEIVEFKSEIDCNPLVNYFRGFAKKIPININNKNGLIITKTKIPNKSLSENQIKNFVALSKKQGFIPNIVENIDKEDLENYSFIGGAEGPEVWYGLKTHKVAALSKESLGASLFVDMGGIAI